MWHKAYYLINIYNSNSHPVDSMWPADVSVHLMYSFVISKHFI
jgi:hypothetical protein